MGQFVLTASLRAQVNPENRSEFKDVSPERYVHPFLAHCVDTYSVPGHLQTLPLAPLCCTSSYLTFSDEVYLCMVEWVAQAYSARALIRCGQLYSEQIFLRLWIRYYKVSAVRYGHGA